MDFRESETVECKALVVDGIKKEIVAFANCEGGKLYIGVDDNGTVVGVQNADEVIQQISNMVRDNIKPDVTMFLHYDTICIEEKQVVVVLVQRGTNRPYYLAKKGLRPEGVYVRQGTSSVPSTDTAIRKMIKETDGDSFEEMRSLEQNLTFEVTGKEFAKRNIAFGQAQMKTLKLVNTDDIYTNLGLLFSEQCMQTIKVATFEGTDQNVFRDRREFSGSLLQQLNEVYDYIDMRNQLHSTFEKLRRIDTRDYPEVAIREALLNTLVHRDYSFRASTLISIYADRMELVSIGGLLPGVRLADVMLGMSVCRNPELANVFYRLELIEAYGTGLRKIMKAYEGSGKTPRIEVTENAFKIVLPNVNVASAEPPKDDYEINQTEKKVLYLTREQGTITRRDAEALLGLSQTSTGRVLRQLMDKSLLVQEGKGKNSKYCLAEEAERYIVE